jgi:hypothetical protein
MLNDYRFRLYPTPAQQQVLLRWVSARTGKLLWSVNVGGRIDKGPSIYAVNGRQYVLVAIGGSTWQAPRIRRAPPIRRPI